MDTKKKPEPRDHADKFCWDPGKLVITRESDEKPPKPKDQIVY